MLKSYLKVLFVSSIILACFGMTVCFASVPVTEVNLKDAFQRVFMEFSSGELSEVSVKNGTVTVLSGNQEEAILSYDLTNQPTFSYTVDVKKGMSYETFEQEAANLSMPMLGYLAVADIQGVAYEDATLYFTMYLLSAALSETSSINLDDMYMIVSDDVTVEGRK